METTKKRLKLSIIFSMILVFTTIIIGTVATFAASSKDVGDIIVHYKGDLESPSVYYWNALPDDLSVEWPGEEMTKEDNDWYTYTFENVTKINFLFNSNGKQTDDLTRNSGEWWYKDGKWSDKNPDAEAPLDPEEPKEPGEVVSSEGGDFRSETIYFVMTTRFFDGYKENNTHCWEDANYKNGDDDPAWRGDFEGLIEKLDYIKALGFSALWITPVVENCSGYDYHGYHASNFKKVDARYESPNADYQDLINACHKKGIKVIQDIVLNHTSNFGEGVEGDGLYPMFTKDEKNLGSTDCLKLTPFGQDVTSKALALKGLKGTYDDYAAKPSIQYEVARIGAMKEDAIDTEHMYHHEKSLSWESYTCQTGQMAGDCVDVDTENPKVQEYLRDAYNGYIDMGVDAFRIDTVKHISRLTFNNEFNQQFKERAAKNGNDDFYMFGEVCSRVREVWNKGIPALSSPFYTWKESKDYEWGDWETNTKSALANYNDNVSLQNQPKSDNHKLKGNEYHKPDYSKKSGLDVIDFPMHWNFYEARNAFSVAVNNDDTYNDATWNVVYVDSHDYAPDECQDFRFTGSQDTWAENLNLMFTFRGIPCIYYGSEIEFMKGARIDGGANKDALAKTGRAYYGDNLEGEVNATDYSEYTASGPVADTLNHPLAKHIQRLNKIRRAIPALQKGQYSTEGVSGDGMAFKRRYTDASVDSFVCVSITGGATFTGVPSGKYVDAITGDTINCTGTLSIPATSKGNMRVFVLNGTGKIGDAGKYLK